MIRLGLLVLGGKTAKVTLDLITQHRQCLPDFTVPFFNNKSSLEFRPRWRQRQKCFASLHNQRKDNNQFKNNKQPEMPEYQPAWNSDNQGIKETFIQTSRRGGDRQMGGEDRSKAVDRAGKEGWAGWETKDSKL